MIQTRNQDIELSVIIAIRDPKKAAPVEQLYDDYKTQINKTGYKFEFIFIIEGEQPEIVKNLTLLTEHEENLKILVFSRWYGDSTSLSAGFDHASGDILITLPANHQIDPNAIPGLIDALGDNDMLVVRRWPRAGRKIGALQVRFFHFVLRNLLGFKFNDLGSAVRIFRKRVVEKVTIYGDQHRFLPVLASHYGFRVIEKEVPQIEEDLGGNFTPGAYINRLLDLLAIFFLTKFTKKPLRFFGFTGMLVFSTGTLLTIYLAYQRLFMNIALADKPVLLLGILLIVLGTLLFAIGLIGEIIIFTHAKEIKEYNVERIIE